MFFSFKSAAKATAFLSVLGFANARADTTLCAGNGPYLATKMYGPSVDDLAFCDTRWDKGIVVTGLQMWATKSHIKAFQLTFSDGSKGDIHGDNSDTEGNNGNWYGQGQVSWKEGELVTDVHLAGNYWGNGDRFGGMTMEVAGQKFETKSDIGSFAGEPQTLASGLLIGAYGSAGSDINSFGLMFLSGSAGQAQIVDMKFPDTLDDMNAQQKGIETVILRRGTFKNSSPEGAGNQTYSFASTESQQKTRTITTSNSHQFGLSITQTISAKVSVPELVEITAETSTTASYQYTTLTSTADMKMDATQTQFSQGGSLAPGYGADCVAKSLTGHYATDYINVVQITMAGGQTFTIEQPAHFDSVGFTQASVDCKTLPIAELPNGGNGAEITKPDTKRAVSFKA